MAAFEMEDFQQRYELVRDDALARDELFEGMLQKLAELEIQVSQSEIGGAKRPAHCDGSHGQMPVILSNRNSRSTKQTMDLGSRSCVDSASHYQDVDSSAPFVVVLVRGDASMLLEEDVKAGESGGAQAVRRITSHLIEYLSERDIFEGQWQLILKFYASMSELGTTYLKSGIIENLSTWRSFINGFNNEMAFSHFVDAGDEPCSTDHKVREQLEVFFGHPDCQHTILIGSADGSYTGFLSQYSRGDDLCGNMTLVEAIPFPGEFRELASRFLPAEKDELFPSKDPYTPSPSPRKTHRRLSSVPIMLRPGAKPRPKPPASPRRMQAPLPPPPVYDQYRTPSPTRKTRLLQSSPTKTPMSQRAPKSQPQLVRRKPLAALQQPRTPQVRPGRSKQINAFFDSRGQRIDSGSYVNMYTQRYLE